MKSPRHLLAGVVAAAALLAAGHATAGPVVVAWTDWTSIGTDLRSATGTMGGIGVTLTAATAIYNDATQIGGAGPNCTNYWTQPDPSNPAYTGGTVNNAPTACEQIALSSANRITVTFDSAVSTLYMGLLSVGQPNLPVTYDFDQAFTLDSEGRGFWGLDADGAVVTGNSIEMNEFHGVLRFNAPVTSLTFSTGAELWQAFTFGRADGTVPEPGSLLLVGGALLAAGAATRRRKA